MRVRIIYISFDIEVKQQVIVIGGGEVFDTYEDYLAFIEGELKYNPNPPKKGWKAELQKTLGHRYEVINLKMPTPLNARYYEWFRYFCTVVPYIKDNAIFVGHSLGGLFLMKFIDENNVPFKTAGCMFVGTPFVWEKIREGFADFVLEDSGHDRSLSYGEMHFFHSYDDVVVPYYNVTHYMSCFPKANLHEYMAQGHFNQEKFPDLVKTIRALTDKTRRTKVKK